MATHVPSASVRPIRTSPEVSAVAITSALRTGVISVQEGNADSIVVMVSRFLLDSVRGLNLPLVLKIQRQGRLLLLMEAKVLKRHVTGVVSFRLSCWWRWSNRQADGRLEEDHLP
ncbi:hypothetical protein AAFF_G00206270 [Aldrovandia affinis]|uniref:Uncharacterized protein n=1 Tax=Aldrovandia affinis TaxID=143900 RepID=A0AAD7W697_9TELE|nr:hypothetical protein AAFF_G00206270 [Aldrovandia affinis]